MVPGHSEEEADPEYKGEFQILEHFGVMGHDVRFRMNENR